MRKRVLIVAALMAVPTAAPAENPIITDLFTADPAAMVYQGKVYLYTGHDEARPTDNRFVMKDWRCFSTEDMVHWKAEGSPMSLKTFAWARSDAWASQVIERDGKFYWYAAIHNQNNVHGGGFAIGVGVADSPTGPFKDALGKPLVTNDMTKGAYKEDLHREMDWDDIDPTVMIDDDGQAYLIWGNTQCYLAKLKKNMIEFDGVDEKGSGIQQIALPRYTEAPWIHKYQGKYYLSYAYEYPEKIAYATAEKMTGPYTFQGVINDLVPNSRTNHQAIIEFKGRWYFIYHNAVLSGHEYRRSVCVDELFYDKEGHILPIKQTREGITEPAGRPEEKAAH
jgi:beta-xylosidase